MDLYRQGASPDAACLKGRLDAAARYASCHQSALSRFWGSLQADADFTALEVRLGKCRVKYAAVWPKLQARAAGTGVTRDHARLQPNGDGTVTDRLTGLNWEQKTDDASVHDKDNAYAFSANGAGLADGTAFTGFLGTLNATGSCFAGDCDWRLPTLAELQTTLLPDPYPCSTSPCIDQASFGPSTSSNYLTMTADHSDGSFTWNVRFLEGHVFSNFDASPAFVRAVRGGL